LVDNE